MKKSNKSKIILLLGCAGVILGAYGLFAYTSQTNLPREILLTSDEARRTFLREYGQPAAETPPDRTEITLPADGNSSKIYAEYCALQAEQQLPTEYYFGESAVVFTYHLSSSETARAELVCTPEGILVGAMCYDRARFEHMYPLIT